MITNEKSEIVVDKIEISINNCYCCFEETDNRSPCECKAYICKKCFKKYKKYETKCKICNTDLIIPDDCIKITKSNIYNYFILFCVMINNLLINPVCIALAFIGTMTIIGILIIIIPCFIFCLLNSLISNTPFILIINFGFWITGVIIIFIILLIIFIIIHIVFGFCILIQEIIKP